MEPLESDFELLYRAQVQSIYRYALALTHNPALAEELTQEAFVRLLQSRAQLKHPGSENSWLCTTVRRLYLDQLRRDGRTQELTELADDSRFEGIWPTRTRRCSSTASCTSCPNPIRRSFPSGCSASSPAPRSPRSSAAAKTGSGSPSAGPS